MPIIRINEDYATRVFPDYLEPSVQIRFESEELFQVWFDNIATKHANWRFKSKRVNEKMLFLLVLPFIHL
jgi:hypothetical protein